MIVLVTGGRDYNDRAQLRTVLSALHKEYRFQILVHGCARGADTLAAVWAMEHGVHPAGVPALWDFYGRTEAGPNRNGAMLLLKPGLVVAFPGGTGTANMVRQARLAGVQVVPADNLDLVRCV